MEKELELKLYHEYIETIDVCIDDVDSIISNIQEVWFYLPEDCVAGENCMALIGLMMRLKKEMMIYLNQEPETVRSFIEYEVNEDE